MALLELVDLHKAFLHPVVRGVHLHLAPDCILCLLGPSGCGKTTLLRLVAGLEAPDKGQVFFEGQNITRVPVHRRKFGLMFQEFALFPHKSVFDNVAFGLQMQKQPPADIRRRTNAMLALVGLADLAQRNVAELSGGERQRVALARSLAPRPRLLMLDEPLGALDRALRERLLIEIRRILKKLGMAAIFVTHDQSEALAVADQIAVMNAGGIEQVGRPEQLYLHPESRFVAQFLGLQNLLPGKVQAGGGVKTQWGLFYPLLFNGDPGQPVTLVLRPEGARLAGGAPSTPPWPKITGTVAQRRFTGPAYRLAVETPRQLRLVFDLPNTPPPPPKGAPIELWIDPAVIVVIEGG